MMKSSTSDANFEAALKAHTHTEVDIKAMGGPSVVTFGFSWRGDRATADDGYVATPELSPCEAQEFKAQICRFDLQEFPQPFREALDNDS